MAGVRLGYALSSDTSFLASMAEKTQCWNVSVMAQEAGIAALECGSWLTESVKQISAERARLTDRLTKLGIRVIPGEANFLLIRSSPEADLGKRLLDRGILVRDCSNYVGLGPGRGWFRIAVRTREENDALLKAVGEVLS